MGTDTVPRYSPPGTVSVPAAVRNPAKRHTGTARAFSYNPSMAELDPRKARARAVLLTVTVGGLCYTIAAPHLERPEPPVSAECAANAECVDPQEHEHPHYLHVPESGHDTGGRPPGDIVISATGGGPTGPTGGSATASLTPFAVAATGTVSIGG